MGKQTRTLYDDLLNGRVQDRRYVHKSRVSQSDYQFTYQVNDINDGTTAEGCMIDVTIVSGNSRNQKDLILADCLGDNRA